MLRSRRAALLALAFCCLLPSVAKAGQGGLITLVNGTPYNWRSSKQTSSNMNSWGFPDVITAGSTATVYVEWVEWARPASQYGYVTFYLEGTDQSFRIAANAVGGYNLRVGFTNLSTLGNPQGSVIDLGWKHNGYHYFILSGVVGSFTSSRPPNAWMHESLGLLGNRSLRNLCIPGSHDAGMSDLGTGTLGAKRCNTVTQEKRVLDQLHSGVRYFDIRPVISGGQFKTGHYTDTGTILGWQGGNGQFLADIIQDVNTYTDSQQELVVLYLSHDRNTDVSYQPFTNGEWCRLLSELTRLNHRFAVPNPAPMNLTTLTLGTFIGQGAAVVVVVKPDDPNVNLDNLGCSVPTGFYKAERFPIFDSYSGTDLLNTMQEDQLAKLHAQRTSPDAASFLLSWTLTQSSDQAVDCDLFPPFVDAPSILELAAGANPFLYQNVLPASNYQTYPNILYIDKVESPDIAALALAVNSKASWDRPRPIVIYKGLDSGIYVSSGRSLTRTNLAINTSATPAAFSFKGNLYVLYKGSGTDSRIYIAKSAGGNILSGGSWNAEPLNPAINTSTAPGVTVFNNTPYMLYKGSGGDANIYIARSLGNAGDGNSWNATRLNPVINTSAAPAVTVFNNTLYLFYKGAGGDANIYIARSGGDVFNGGSWNFSRLNTGINTSDAPGAVVYNGELYMFYKGSGSDSNIYVARSTGGDVFNGASWSFTRLNPGINTTAAPKPLVVGGSLYLLYKGLENYIWVAKPQGADIFNGNAWQWQPLDPSITTDTGPGGAAL